MAPLVRPGGAIEMPIETPSENVHWRAAVKFRTRILQARKTATGIEVPASVVAALDAGKRPKVSVTLNGYTYRSSIAVMGGKYLIGVSARVREKAGVAGGD